MLTRPRSFAVLSGLLLSAAQGCGAAAPPSPSPAPTRLVTRLGARFDPSSALDATKWGYEISYIRNNEKTVPARRGSRTYRPAAGAS